MALRPRPTALPGIVVVIAALTAFSCALSGEFLAWDDEINFTGNSHFRGLGWSQIRWAFTTYHLGVYQPFAWLLLEGQYVLSALDPFGYHLVSVCLHALNSLLLYWLLARLLTSFGNGDGAGQPQHTFPCWGRDLVAAAVALLWGLHPLRVEVVAWASCQPYLLSASFALLATLAYLRAADPDEEPWRWRLASLLLYGAGLMSKAAVLALPVAFIVLDVFPLRRLQVGRGAWRWRGTWRGSWKVWLEKLPFFLLAGLFAGLAVRSRVETETLHTLEDLGFGPRIAQAAVAVWFYLEKTVWPVALSPYYPRPADLDRGLFVPAYAAALAGVLVATGVLLWRARRWPALLAAWLIYLAFLMPHAGLIRISGQLGADRYAYLPTLGLFAALAAGLHRLHRLLRARVAPPAATGLSMRLAVVPLALAISVLGVLSFRQSSIWQSSDGLWSYVYPRGGDKSSLVANNWAATLMGQGRFLEAAAVLRGAIALKPDNAKALSNLSTVHLRLGHERDAEDAARKVVALRPDAAWAHLQLGTVLLAAGKWDAAEPHLRRAVALDPDLPAAQQNLAALQARKLGSEVPAPANPRLAH